MDDPFSPERKTVRLNKQNLFGSGYAGLGDPLPSEMWLCDPHPPPCTPPPKLETQWV
jgi:hypothetical protein